MARVQFGAVPFDAGLVAFDKDGTLLDFEVMWGRLARTWVEHLAAAAGDEELRPDLYRCLGYDLPRERTLPQSPLAIATTGQLLAIVAGTLYRHGIAWPEAEDRAREAFEVGAQLPLAGLVRPTGDVAGLFQRLRNSGVRVAVVTTDYRAPTEEALHLLGVAHLVDALVCDDDGLPSKPAPDLLLAACHAAGVEPARTAAVGDTLADLLMARRAGAGLRVAVLSGAGDVEQLSAEADVVLPSIDGITVGDPT
jgi:phosphoglycolate phosphatase